MFLIYDAEKSDWGIRVKEKPKSRAKLKEECLAAQKSLVNVQRENFELKSKLNDWLAESDKLGKENNRLINDLNAARLRLKSNLKQLSELEGLKVVNAALVQFCITSLMERENDA